MRRAEQSAGRLVVLLLLCASCASCASSDRPEVLDQQKATIAQLQKKLELRERQVVALEAELDTVAEQLFRERRGGPALSGRDAQLNTALKQAGFRLDRRDARSVIALESAILFAPGRADLTAEGTSSLARLARILAAQAAGRSLRIEGHTDNTPVKKTKDIFKDNWGLSSARALAVLRFLIEQGLPREQVCAGCFADTRPVGDNATAEGRQANRRVDLVFLD